MAVDSLQRGSPGQEPSSSTLEASHLIGTQEEIAQNVVAAIAGDFGIIARRLSAQSRKMPQTQLSTYEAMLRDYTHQISPSPESGAACLDAL